jgi:hypothetical protein
MKKLLLILSVITTTLSVKAQVTPAKLLKKTVTLGMPRTVDDSMPGTRGASVVWHPLQKKYYAAMAGNAQYPLGVFDMSGKLLSPGSLNCDADVRGLWYNALKKQVQGNSYSDYGWFAYTLNTKGIPGEATIFIEGKNQPDDQSAGAFSLAKQQVLFLNSGEIFFYNIKGEALDQSLTIRWGRTKNDGPGEEEEAATPDDYNNSTVVFTGLKGAELGFLNITEMQIELYNMANGFLTKKLKLPEEAPMNSSFNFAYTNGMYWLFDIESRTWTGYK